MIVIILLLIGAKLFAPDYFFNVGMKSFEKKDYENEDWYFVHILGTDAWVRVEKCE